MAHSSRVPTSTVLPNPAVCTYIGYTSLSETHETPSLPRLRVKHFAHELRCCSKPRCGCRRASRQCSVVYLLSMLQPGMSVVTAQSAIQNLLRSSIAQIRQPQVLQPYTENSSRNCPSKSKEGLIRSQSQLIKATEPQLRATP